MEMVLWIALIVLGFILLIKGADLLVEGASNTQISQREVVELSL